MRLIDADALPVCKEHCIYECGFGANFYVVHKTDIDAAPTITIEAEPVKHGRWEDFADKLDRRFGRMDLQCSVCGNRADNFVSGRDDWWEDTKPNYCPNCGAKMDLEEA